MQGPRTSRRRKEWPGMRCTSSCLTKTPQGCGQGQSLTLGRRSGYCSTPWSMRTSSVLFVQILDAPVPQLGEQLVHFLQVFGHAVARRAGYRRAQDLRRHHTAALGRPRSAPSADCGTVGGSADCLVLCFAPAVDCRAHRQHSSSAWSWVLRWWRWWSSRVFSQDRVILCLPSRSLTIQFRAVVVIMEVFNVFSKDSIQLRLLSRALTFHFLPAEALNSLILVDHALPQYRVMRLFKGVVTLFTDLKKVRIPPGVHAGQLMRLIMWFVMTSGYRS